MRRALAILLLVLAAGGARAETVRFPSVAVGNVAAGPEITGWLYRPDGPGPFPAMVLAHPCNGVSEHTNGWGRLLASWGYVTVAPDSFGPRGEKSVCGRGRAVTGGMRVTDVAGALDWLNAQPFVKRNTIGLIGHSHGGWTTMRAVQANVGLAQRGLRAAVAYYPACSTQFDRTVAVPLLILIGDRDDWTPAEDCRRLQAAGFAQPALVEAVYYPNAYHSFDNRAVGDRTITVADGKSHRLAYNPVAGPDAEARARAFFDKYLK
ncbi:MAG: dienelactone hydrolase family protein [Reyranella sp.]|uniref:dienelactone hydrolase family protein n=1 Tax=Reyranella sp. TaxID=1929291 RepID=UPI001AC3990B|nr:dienelactone hydrolase family protein [Reyranella sp.]MBN9090674.1 dienelactone hydrolase family protein [Reyranella sp.]